MAEQDWMGAREYLQQAVVIVEKFEVLVAAWQVHATAWQFYRHTKEGKPAEASRGRAEACILKIANSFARDEPLRASFLPLPYCSRPRRVGKQESGLLRILETEGLREKPRSGGTALRHGHGPRFASQRS